MDFEEAKHLLSEAIDEAKSRGDILRIWIEKIYQKGKDDCNTCSQTVPIPTDEGKLCCDACGCEIKEGQETCECCKRKIDWNK